MPNGGTVMIFEGYARGLEDFDRRLPEMWIP